MYRAINGVAVAQWKATLRQIAEGTSITWDKFVAVLRMHRVTADGCTCANCFAFAMCEGVLLWHLIKGPGLNYPPGIYGTFLPTTVLSCTVLSARLRYVLRHQKRSAHEIHGNLHHWKKRRLQKGRRKVVAGSDADSDTDVPTLSADSWTTCPLEKAPNDGEAESTTLAVPQKVDSMEVHRKNWHCLNLFWPPYVCGQCHKAVYLWGMHCEGVGFCLLALVCPICGRAHPNTEK